MTANRWETLLQNIPQPDLARARLEQLKEHEFADGLSDEHARVLLTVLGASQSLAELLIAHPAWIQSLQPDQLKSSRPATTLHREADAILAAALPSEDHAQALKQIREFKHREQLRIAARDLNRFGGVEDITAELSHLADACLSSLYRISLDRWIAKAGQPFHQSPNGDWKPTQLAVFGMGKLGGGELNYSSDVDVIFVYSDEGFTFREPPKAGSLSGKGIANHQFFTRLIETFVKEVSQMTEAGFLYRIDLRLRPQGNAGPLAGSLASYENYYAQWGQTWERMMLIKARPVAGDPALAAEFIETIQPFRYPRSVAEGVLQEIAAMKRRIENEVVKSGEVERNVKLGRGGIREIEFLVQTLQLLHGGRNPFLQGRSTLPTLEKLVQYSLLPPADAAALKQAYIFLRDVEHRLQMENNQQTHSIPISKPGQERLALLMGFDSIEAFQAVHSEHKASVRAIYDQLLQSSQPEVHDSLPSNSIDTAPDEWITLLKERRFRDPEKARKLIQVFLHGPGYVHVSPRTQELARQLIAKFLGMCPNSPQSNQRQAEATPESDTKILSDPDRVLVRIDSFASAYGSRAMLYELWAGNPSLFHLYLLLFDRSEFLAESAIRTPDLVDELQLSGRLRRRKSAEETLSDLRHGARDTDQRVWIRRYHQAELMRIGLREILGLADFEQNLTELSALADACLSYALEAVMRRHKTRSAPFAIIGLGKLGGAEINYGSDLDIILVAGPKAKDSAKLQKLAVELIDILAAQTEHGATFEIDTRLRPDGEKGALVSTLASFEDYYLRRADLWEIQTLSRARFIAGPAKVGDSFMKLAHRLTNFEKPVKDLRAYQPDWKDQIARMRLRIESERTPAGKNHLAIKTGKGGLIDAEFAAQALCHANGVYEPNTLRALEASRNAAAATPDEMDDLIANYRKLRRVEGILRRWSYAGETVLPDDPAPLYRVAVRCGFPDIDPFMKAVAQYREAIHVTYEKIMA